MTVINYSKITSLIIFLIVPVNLDFLNTVFKCEEATFFGAAFEPLLLILSNSRSLERCLSEANKLTLNQCPITDYVLGTRVRLLPLNKWSVVISCKKTFLFDFEKVFNVFCVFF